jgi:hypothetical protein
MNRLMPHFGRTRPFRQVFHYDFPVKIRARVVK